MNLLCIILNVFQKHIISKENHKTNHTFEKPSTFYVIAVKRHKLNKTFFGQLFSFERKAEADTNTHKTNNIKT